MPGTFNSLLVLAFNLDGRGQPVRAFQPRPAASQDAAIEEARHPSKKPAGVLVWRRDGDPVVGGEEGEPMTVFQTGRTGDFD